MKTKQENLCRLELGQDFLDMTAEAQSIKGGGKAIHYSSNRHHYKNEKTNHRLGKILINHTSDKRLTARIYSELLKQV